MSVLGTQPRVSSFPASQGMQGHVCRARPSTCVLDPKAALPVHPVLPNHSVSPVDSFAAQVQGAQGACSLQTQLTPFLTGQPQYPDLEIEVLGEREGLGSPSLSLWFAFHRYFTYKNLV